MSIQDMRERLKDLPGAERMVMQYAEGGKKQVFSIDNISVFVGPTATADQIRAAFLKAMAPKKVAKKRVAKVAKNVTKKAAKKRPAKTSAKKHK